jgi:hypothetical protein
MFRAIIFFGLATSGFANATLAELLDAAANLSVAIQQQLVVVQSDPVSDKLDEKTIEYAKAKTAYCQALRAAMPELIDIATGRQARPLELDKIATVFSLAGERQETIADRGTLFLLERFSGNPGVEKPRVEFERAQEIEEIFHKDFDGLNFTLSIPAPHPLALYQSAILGKQADAAGRRPSTR